MTKRIKARADAPRIILLTAHAEPGHQAAAHAARADGFVAKAESSFKLMTCIGQMFPEASKVDGWS